MLGPLYTNGKINALVSETISDWHEPFYCEQEYTFQGSVRRKNQKNSHINWLCFDLSAK